MYTTHYIVRLLISVEEKSISVTQVNLMVTYDCQYALRLQVDGIIEMMEMGIR